ncbi:MAG: hypothetical protein KGK07_16230, partial [Chloroflexota bacterium]|nr:hypothetical protein [Chloroflexota bacterium]
MIPRTVLHQFLDIAGQLAERVDLEGAVDNCAKNVVACLWWSADGNAEPCCVGSYPVGSVKVSG